MPPRGLYLLTPDWDDDRRLIEATAAALGGGVALLQYRNKTLEPTRRRDQAQALRALCDARGVPLVVNDDVELAAAIGADGVHLGRDDGDVAAARARLGPDAILGVSCYADAGRANAAAAAGADYLAFGAFHPSPTKPGAVRASPDLLAAAAGLGLPRVAIGGIDAHNAGALVDAGADLVAVISAVYATDDPGAAARRIASLFHARTAP